MNLIKLTWVAMFQNQVEELFDELSIGGLLDLSCCYLEANLHKSCLQFS